MRAITKLSEPASLTEHRETKNADFDNLPQEAKQELRERLVAEQRGLCCYCCGRITPEAGKMKVEHWRSQSPNKYPQHQLDYWNLLGACMGNEGQPENLQHCDTQKRDRELTLNPSNPEHRIEEVIHYLTDGSVRSDDHDFNAQLGENPRAVHQDSKRILNLNLPFLMNNRKASLDAFQKGLTKRGSLQKITLQKLLAKWSSDDGAQLDPYSPVVVHWLKKKLRKV